MSMAAAAQRAVAHLGPPPRAAACHRPLLPCASPLPLRQLAPCRRRQSAAPPRIVAAAAGAGGAAVPEPGGGRKAPAAAAERHPTGFLAHLQPLSEPASNKKLLALSIAQMFSSIATLMHDTYLPLCEWVGVTNVALSGAALP